MYIFIVSVLVVTFIALCFYKSKFWENRYMILIVISCVALVATFTTNFVIRDKTQVRTELSRIRNITSFYLSDSVVSNYILITDSLFTGLDDIDYLTTSDSCKIKMSLVFMGDSTNRTVGVINRFGRILSHDFDDIYIVPSESDTISYVAKKSLYYDIKSNKWTAGKIPKISTISCLFIPPTEYLSIPNSLIRTLPF